jgi:hypothetical protein
VRDIITDFKIEFMFERRVHYASYKHAKSEINNEYTQNQKKNINIKEEQNKNEGGVANYSMKQLHKSGDTSIVYINDMEHQNARMLKQMRFICVCRPARHGSRTNKLQKRANGAHIHWHS